MMGRIKLFLFLTLLFPVLGFSYLNTRIHPFYAGLIGGYGSNTWNGLVPIDSNEALSISVPIRTQEKGTVLGAMMGYEILPQFAVEGSYIHYPNANIYFDPKSLFSFNHGDITKLVSHTERFGVNGKIMFSIPCTLLRAYANIGVAEVYRHDKVRRAWRISPLFGGGIDYPLCEHFFVALGTEYVAGYGRSELDPAEHFIPFLYSVFLQLNYRV